MKDMNRRKFNKLLGASVVGVPLSGLIAQLPSHADDLPMVDSEAANAVALQYTDASTKDGMTCSSCSLYQGGDADAGPCPLFPGSHVAGMGWCSAYVPKG